ncbi:OprO/OprP family phosphate-selective porin [Pendulispora rubella]|uniref:OprO/OprP family phosphate-selective porin n=1 Tax=Pendulispora rubella TaxID=2741070 RepID=A0ABZ2L3V2_9BACT
MKFKSSFRSTAQRSARSLLFLAVLFAAIRNAAAQEPVPPSPSPLLPPSEVEERMRALETKLAAIQEKDEKRSKLLEWLEHLRISGYLQPQLIWQSFNDAASPNVGAGNSPGLPGGIGPNSTIARPDGTTTNPDFFRLRRARLKTEVMPSEYAKFVFEIDPNLAGGTAVGTGTIAKNTEAVAIIPWSKDVRTEIGMGIFKIPFGNELLQSDADRPFIERGWAEQNFTPGEFDTGVRAYTTALEKKLTVQAAVVNGVTEGERNFTIVPDLNRGKDVVGRVNLNIGPADAGVSGVVGEGAVVDSAALRFQQYRRWGVNFEAAVHHPFVKSLGTTKLSSELVLAHNLDRGVRYAFALPTITTNDGGNVGSHDERALFVRLEQDFSKWFTLGLRYDMYTPDSAQKNNARDTYSTVFVVHFTKGLQLMLEYDHAIDNVHRPGASAPSRHIESFSSVLQVRI